MARVVFKKGAFLEIRTTGPVFNWVNGEADRIARNAGDGYLAKPAAVAGGRGRARAAVVTTGPAVRTEAKEHRLANSI